MIGFAGLPSVNHLQEETTNHQPTIGWYCHGWFLQHKSQWIEAAYYSKTMYIIIVLWCPLTWDKVAYYCKAESPDLTNQGCFAVDVTLMYCIPVFWKAQHYITGLDTSGRKPSLMSSTNNMLRKSGDFNQGLMVHWYRFGKSRYNKKIMKPESSTSRTLSHKNRQSCCAAFCY